MDARLSSPLQLVRYDAMVTAIAECHRVDEVKDLKDKARALEVYARQARNIDAERQACAVRLRAERRVGELLRDLRRAPGIRTDVQPAASLAGGSEYRRAIDSAGIPERTAERYQELAKVPQEQFEAALADPDIPTTSGILRGDVPRAPLPNVQMDDDALWIWGELRDWERMKLTECDAPAKFRAMTNTMQADVRRIVPRVIEQLRRLTEDA